MHSVIINRLFAFTILVTIGINAIGQSAARPTEVVNGLIIGAKVPDLPIQGLVNYEKANAKISDFKGKLLILDFWATWCAPCIASFSKIDSLQKEFGERIQILPVSTEPKNSVVNFFNKFKRLTNLSPVSVTGDIYLHNYFKHSFLPHYVWIDRNQTLIAITDGEELNSLNIRQVLEGNDLFLKFKRDTILEIVEETGKPILLPGINVKSDSGSNFSPIAKEELLRQSVFSKYIDGIASGMRTDAPEILSLMNLNILSLYKYVFWETGIEILNASNTFTKVDIRDDSLYEIITFHRKDGRRLANPGYESIEKLKQFGYCYELFVPTFLIETKYRSALAELNQYFGTLYKIEGVKEVRLVKYLSLIRTTKEDKIATKAGNKIYKSDKISLKIQNEKISSLLYALAIPLQTYPPIIDETNYPGNVDIEFTCHLSDLDAVNKELKKYGLKLVEKQKKMLVGVIRDKPAK